MFCISTTMSAVFFTVTGQRPAPRSGAAFMCHPLRFAKQCLYSLLVPVNRTSSIGRCIDTMLFLSLAAMLAEHRHRTADLMPAICFALSAPLGIKG